MDQDLQTISTSYASHIKQYNRTILTDECKEFLAALQENFNHKRKEHLEARNNRALPKFDEGTAAIRNADWKIAPIPADLQDRRVEITGPVNRKMVINALNSGANMFMADFEDSNTPLWSNCIQGQQNLYDAVRGTIRFNDEAKGKTYQLNETIATLLVRPRGLHMEESNFLIDDQPTSASLFDFGVYFFHNAKTLLQNNSGAYFYLPKLEHYLEARWWNEVFVFAQDHIGISKGNIKATVLIETIWASFYMDEILYELRDHSAGLNCGRWDYLFSFIKTFKTDPNYIFPNKSQITMESPCMKAYTELLVQTCHRRGAHAMGGMAAQIPIKNNAEANEIAINKVRQDKLREVIAGHDGTWVAHPGLVATAKGVFDQHMPLPNQIDKQISPKITKASELLQVPQGTITLEGVLDNINVSILYLESWLRGKGAAALYHKMEDAATAEISRTQLWQWIAHEIIMDNKKPLTASYCEQLIEEAYQQLTEGYSETQMAFTRFIDAKELMIKLVCSKEYIEFLTSPAYKLLNH